jgi:hypothetical protein
MEKKPDLCSLIPSAATIAIDLLSNFFPLVIHRLCEKRGTNVFQIGQICSMATAVSLDETSYFAMRDGLAIDTLNRIKCAFRKRVSFPHKSLFTSGN